MEWTGLRSQLTAELEETKRVARVRIDAMQEELRTRREKQYAVLSRLQAADEGLRKSQDDTETLRETGMSYKAKEREWSTVVVVIVIFIS